MVDIGLGLVLFTHEQFLPDRGLDGYSVWTLNPAAGKGTFMCGRGRRPPYGDLPIPVSVAVGSQRAWKHLKKRKASPHSGCTAEGWSSFYKVPPPHISKYLHMCTYVYVLIYLRK